MPRAVVSMRCKTDVDIAVVEVECGALILPQSAEGKLSAGTAVACSSDGSRNVHRAVGLLFSSDDIDGVQTREVSAVLLGGADHEHGVGCCIDCGRARDADRGCDVR